MASLSRQLKSITEGQPLERKRAVGATFLPSAAAAFANSSTIAAMSSQSSSSSVKKQKTVASDIAIQHSYNLPLTEPDLQLLVDDAVALNRGERYRFSELIVVSTKVALGLDALNTQLKEGVVAEEAKWAHYNPSTNASVHVDVFVWERMIYQSVAKQHPHKETVRTRV